MRTFLISSILFSFILILPRLVSADEESCGDGILQIYESCDDGNRIIADGCNDICELEECGNAVLDPNEACDYGNDNSSEGECNLTCQLQERDCKGVFGGPAKIDRCGVCAGDGLSCVSCTSTLNTDGQIIMDGSASDLNKLVVRATNKLSQVGTRNLNAYIKKVRAEAQALYVESWILTWSIPITTQSCSSVFCVNASHADLITNYTNNILELDNLVKGVVKKIRKVSGKRRLGRSYLSHSDKLKDAGLAKADVMPKTTSVCI